jgi:hypothetical protein
MVRMRAQLPASSAAHLTQRLPMQASLLTGRISSEPAPVPLSAAAPQPPGDLTPITTGTCAPVSSAAARSMLPSIRSATGVAAAATACPSQAPGAASRPAAAAEAVVDVGSDVGVGGRDVHGVDLDVYDGGVSGGSSLRHFWHPGSSTRMSTFSGLCGNSRVMPIEDDVGSAGNPLAAAVAEELEVPSRPLEDMVPPQVLVNHAAALRSAASRSAAHRRPRPSFASRPVAALGIPPIRQAPRPARNIEGMAVPEGVELNSHKLPSAGAAACAGDSKPVGQGHSDAAGPALTEQRKLGETREVEVVEEEHVLASLNDEVELLHMTGATAELLESWQSVRAAAPSLQSEEPGREQGALSGWVQPVSSQLGWAHVHKPLLWQQQSGSW